MTTEDLQLILNTVKELSAGASTLAVWWLVVAYVLPYLVGALSIITAGYVVLRVFAMASYGRWFKDIADRYEIQYCHGWTNSDDVPRVQRYIEKQLAKQIKDSK